MGAPRWGGSTLARRPFALLCLFVLVSLATRWLSLGVAILDVDEAAHAVGSWVLLDGGRLYTAFVDNKPPLLYGYYAAIQAVLGRGLREVHLATAVLTVPLTALAASAFFGHDRRGAVAGLLWLLFGASFLAHDMLSANAELVLLLPAAWALALVADEDRAARAGPLFAAGLLLGLATLVKHQAAFWLPAAGLVALRARGPTGRALRAAALVAGFAAPLAATWAAFAATGGAGPMVYWLLTRNVGYAANPISAAGALRRAAVNLLPWLAAVTPLAWAWRRGRADLGPHLRLLVDASVVFGLVPALVGFRFFPHYFVPAGFALALGAAPAVAALLTRPLPRAGRAFAAATGVLVVGFAVANAWLYLGPRPSYRERDPAYRGVSDRIAADPCGPGGRLFVWGWAPGFYYEAGLQGVRPASRFVALAQGGLTSYVPGDPESERRRAPGDPDPSPASWALLAADLEATPATFLVDTSTVRRFRWSTYPMADYPFLAALVRDRYESFAEVDGVRVYRLRGCAPQ